MSVGSGLLLAVLGAWVLLARCSAPSARSDVGPVTADAQPAPDAPGEPDGGPPRPHPIAPEHQGILLENQYNQALNDAMELRDGAKLRRLAARYRAEKFEDVDKLADGYEVVANCLEHPGAAARGAAQAFFDQERGSILRRHVSRHCLE